MQVEFYAHKTGVEFELGHDNLAKSVTIRHQHPDRDLVIEQIKVNSLKTKTELAQKIMGDIIYLKLFLKQNRLNIYHQQELIQEIADDQALYDMMIQSIYLCWQ